MFCPYCGTANADNTIVCTQCGKNMQPVATGQVLPPVAGQTVPNYLVFAILATVFCCLPFGIPAIVYAAQVNGKLQAGDFAGAQQASKNAKMWCWISFGAGIAVMVIYAAVIIASMASHRYR